MKAVKSFVESDWARSAFGVDVAKHHAHFFSTEAGSGGESAVWDDAGLDAGVEKVVPGGEEALAEFAVFHVGVFSC